LVRVAPAYRSRSSSGSRFTAVTFGLLLFNPVRAIVKLIAQHGHRGNMNKWVSDLWLDYDSVALAVLVIGIGIVMLLALSV
jgi:hypothetical protein